jgi:hypothetical protein
MATPPDKIAPRALAVWEARFGGKLDCLLSDLRRIITEYLNFAPEFSPQSLYKYRAVPYWIGRELEPPPGGCAYTTFAMPDTNDWALEITYAIGGGYWRIEYFMGTTGSLPSEDLCDVIGRSHRWAGEVVVEDQRDDRLYTKPTQIATADCASMQNKHILLIARDPKHVSISVSGGERKVLKRRHYEIEFIRIIAHHPVRISIIPHFADYVL